MNQNQIRIAIQKEDFLLQNEYDFLAQSPNSGAIVTFSGKVREDKNKQLKAIEIECYEEMALKSLRKQAEFVFSTWNLQFLSIIHRIGILLKNEQIVFIGASSAHRKNAFDATQYLMDFLKNYIPFWKKEHFLDHQIWVEQKTSDVESLKKWNL